MTANPPAGMSRIVPYLFYEDVAGVLAWLTKAFGFVEHLRYTEDDGSVTHAEMRVADAVIMLGDPGGSYENPRHHGHLQSNLVVYVDGVDDHCARAEDAGAEVISEPADTPYGDRMYSVRDPEGHRWDFCQHERDVAPEDWGATVTNPQ
jgi:uncharacterized glyoxalase superfamily protein PhnB